MSKAKRKPTVAEKIQRRLFDEMNDRRGFHVDTLDDETREHFRQAFLDIIESELRKSPKPKSRKK